MSTQINISNRDSKFWYQSANIFVRGGIYLQGTFLEKEDFAEYLSQLRTKSIREIKKTVAQLNGSFAFILKTESNQTLAFVDKARSLPLFYQQLNGQLIISTESEFIAEQYPSIQINRKQRNEFKSFGYTLGEDTLIRGIKQIQASNFIYLENNEIIQEEYFDFIHPIRKAESIESLKIELKNIIEHCFERLIPSLGDRMLIIPLSGGYDSRIILSLLKKHHYQNVLCYTYGKKDSTECIAAREIAKRLGYKWVLTEYSKESVQGFLDDPDFVDYYKYMSNHSSMFFMEEYYSLKQLKEKFTIPEDAIFIPGHSGDSISGSHLRMQHKDLQSNKQTSKELIAAHSIYHNSSNAEKNIYADTITSQLSDKGACFQRLEAWNYQNRQAKFILNSARIYNFHSYEHRLPLWDNELINFFCSLPFSLKMNNKLYNETLEDYFFKPLDIHINVKPKTYPKQGFVHLLKAVIKRNLPTHLKKLLLEKNDFSFYEEITNQLGEDEKKKGRNIKLINNYNSLIIQWYLNNKSS